MNHTKKTEVLAQGRFLRLVSADGWEYTERTNISGIVGIVAVTDEGKLLLVEQFRPAVGKRVIELPAGLAGDDADTRSEDLADAAERELLEETGYSAEQMEFICEGPPSSGTSSEIITLFYAHRITRSGEGGGDDTEDLTIYEIPWQETHEWLESKRRAGVLIDLRIYTGLYFVERMLDAGYLILDA
jgi:ADP-ribose pyrophosphatase